jgi:hypothetical protein
VYVGGCCGFYHARVSRPPFPGTCSSILRDTLPASGSRPRSGDARRAYADLAFCKRRSRMAATPDYHQDRCAEGAFAVHLVDVAGRSSRSPRWTGRNAPSASAVILPFSARRRQSAWRSAGVCAEPTAATNQTLRGILFDSYARGPSGPIAHDPDGQQTTLRKNRYRRRKAGPPKRGSVRR